MQISIAPAYFKTRSVFHYCFMKNKKNDQFLNMNQFDYRIGKLNIEPTHYFKI